jgi:hypothetical protein
MFLKVFCYVFLVTFLAHRVGGSLFLPSERPFSGLYQDHFSSIHTYTRVLLGLHECHFSSRRLSHLSNLQVRLFAIFQCGHFNQPQEPLFRLYNCRRAIQS